MKPKRQTIAVFDFDGTITNFDSLNYLIIQNFGSRNFYGYMISISTLLFLYKLNIIDNQQIKERLFKHFFRNWQLTKFDKTCQQFAHFDLPKILNQKALTKIRWHQKRNHQVIIISASCSNWIKPLVKKLKLGDFITSTLEVKNGKVAGNFQYNCYGREKLIAFLKKFPDRSRYVLHVYGDGRGDLDLLKIADYPHYQKF